MMKIDLQYAPYAAKSVLRHLLELCHHDYSEFNHMDVDEHGLFGYKYLDSYWTESERHPFGVKVDGRWAGFALIRQIGVVDGVPVHEIAEFFIVRKYRRVGVGREVAWQIFDTFAGWWHVSQEAENRPAQAFWRRVIGEYRGGDYEEVVEEGEEWLGPVQRFRSRAG